MKTAAAWFNIYLLFALVLLTPACKTTEEKKKKEEATRLQIYLEANPDGSGRTVPVSIYRRQPIQFYVQNEPFLTEADVAMASVVPAIGGYSIKIQFNQHGTWILDNITTSNLGRRLVVRAQFGEDRYLQAAQISSRIPNGTLVFVPDASPEEAARIVRGLNNVAAELQKKSRW